MPPSRRTFAGDEASRTTATNRLWDLLVGTATTTSSSSGSSGGGSNNNSRQRRSSRTAATSFSRVSSLFRDTVVSSSPSWNACDDLVDEPTTRNFELPGCELYDLVLELQWDEARRHVERRPIDAHYQEGDTLETPLYLACQNRPPVSLVRALLLANPDAAATKCREHGDLPIHMACRSSASLEVIQELLRSRVDAGEGGVETAAQTTKWGTTPLQVLWQSNRTSIYPTDYSVHPVFWRKVDALLEAVARHRQYYGPSSSSEEEEAEPVDPSVDATIRRDRLYLVHAAVSLGSLGCPHEVLDYVLRQYPKQVPLKTEIGRQLPLHVAVGPALYDAIAKRRKYRPREKYAITRLLNLDPSQARVPLPDSGRYPLHAAVAHRHGWRDGGVRELFHAAPDLLGKRDPMTGLYPFQLAACSVAGHAPHGTVDLDSIYGLLRARPEALALCRNGDEADADTSNENTGDGVQDAIVDFDDYTYEIRRRRRRRRRSASGGGGCSVSMSSSSSSRRRASAARSSLQQQKKRKAYNCKSGCAAVLVAVAGIAFGGAGCSYFHHKKA